MKKVATWAAAILLAGALVAQSGCGGERRARAAEAPAGGAGATGSGTPEVTVFAAASLTESFRDLASALDSAGRGPRARLNLAGSQQLAAQILDGAPADVYASANEAQMDRVVDGGRVAAGPVVFAENGLAIATEPGNPYHIRTLDDLTRPGLKVVLAAPEVPVGRYAREALRKAGVKLRPVSLETDVKEVLAKVVLGEADAGIVYRTDVLEAGKDAVTGIPLPPRSDVRARYEVALLRNAPHPAAARAFLAFLRSDRGRGILEAHGFETAHSGPGSAFGGELVPSRDSAVRAGPVRP